MAGVYPADVAIPSMPPARFLLRRLDGRVESAIAPEQPAMTSRLLAALLTTREGEPVQVTRLATAVYDRLLSQVYLAELGPTVTCRASCGQCAQSFEFSFALPDLLARQDEEAAAIGPPGDDGYWVAGGGVKLRPPTLADGDCESAEAMLSRIAAGPVAADQIEMLSAFLETASPLLSLDIDTHCPECGAAQRVWFDLARYLILALAGERPFLIRETHLIAARYGWSHREIMALPRADRRAHAALIESERSAALRRAS